MMARSAASTLIGATAFFLQVSFIASLPDPLSTIPLVLAVGAAVTQHLGVRDGASWIAAAGIAFDAFGLTPMGFGTISGLAAAGWLIFASQHVFSNRSLYGIVLCVTTTVAAWILAATVILLIYALSGRLVDWSAHLHASAWTLLLSLPSAGILFRFTPRLRPLLDRSHGLVHHT